MTRVRQRDATYRSAPVIQNVYDNLGNVTSTYQWSPGGKVGTKDLIRDEVTPGYRKKRAKGEIIMNPVYISKESFDATTGGHIQVGPGLNYTGHVTIDGDIGADVAGSAGITFSQDTTRLSAIALTKAYSAMNSCQIMSGEILSDFGKTLSMLRRPFSGAIDLLGKMRSYRTWLKKRKSYNEIKAISQTWLEYRYGWKPLVMDGIEAINLTEKVKRRHESGFQVARGGASNARSASRSVNTNIYSGTYTAVGTATANEELAVSAGVLFSPLSTTMSEAMSQALGLNARSIPSTVWEIIPFSFVADWFVNVGPWLEAVVPRPDVRVRSSWVTIVYNYDYQLFSGKLSRTYLGQTYTGSYNGYRYKANSVTRSIDPALSFTPSLLVKPLSMNQTIDALALSVGKITNQLSAFRH